MKLVWCVALYAQGLHAYKLLDSAYAQELHSYKLGRGDLEQQMKNFLITNTRQVRAARYVCGHARLHTCACWSEARLPCLNNQLQGAGCFVPWPPDMPRPAPALPAPWPLCMQLRVPGLL